MKNWENLLIRIDNNKTYHYANTKLQLGYN